MKHIKLYLLFLTATLTLQGCEENYERKPGCNLDQMGVKGDVTKIETIVQSTMPLTEIFAQSIDVSQAISTYIGNVTIDFNKYGNAKHTTGYGMDGKVLYDQEVRISNQEDAFMTPFIPFGGNGDHKINRVKTISSNNKRVVGVQYFDNDKLLWEQTASYNEDGSVKSIIKERKIYDFLSWGDTTTFNYFSYDKMGNWTEAEVNYKGKMPKHAHSYRIKRLITYEGESNPALIDQLKKYNQTSPQKTTLSKSAALGKYGTIQLPNYMKVESDKEIREFMAEAKMLNIEGFKYLMMSSYQGKDAYATLSVNLTHTSDFDGFEEFTQSEMEYDDDTNEYIKEMQTQGMAQGGTYVAKWVSYGFTTISGMRAMAVKYYRYGHGSPIPVYCEDYTIPLLNGYTMNIIYSFQSNLEAKFKTDFDNAIKSVKLTR